MSLPNDTIETAIPLPPSPFTVDLRDANVSDYSGWNYDAFWTYTAPSDGHLAFWLLYAEESIPWNSNPLIWRSPLTSAQYIDYEVPLNCQDLDDQNTRYGSMLDVAAGEKVYLSLGRSGIGPPANAYTVHWRFNPSPGDPPAGASGGRAAIIVGQQLNGLEPIDREWTFHAITREGPTVAVAASHTFTLTRDTNNDDHAITRIDDTRALWLYESDLFATCYARILTFNGTSISVGPETSITNGSAYIDHAQVACSDGNIVYFAMHGYPGGDQWHATFQINADGTLTQLDVIVETCNGSYDMGVKGTGTGRAMIMEYMYSGTIPGPGHSVRKVTWDSSGQLTLGSRVSVPYPPYNYDYYQSFLDYANGYVFLCESWDTNPAVPPAPQTKMGIRAINPDTVEVGPMSNHIITDYDQYSNDTSYWESLEACRQQTQVGHLADGQLGISYPRFKEDAYRTWQMAVHPISLNGLEVTVNTDIERVYYEEMSWNLEQGTSADIDENYLSTRTGFLHYGLALSWWYDSIDGYHHVVAQSLSATAGHNYVTLDLDPNTRYTWIATPLYGEGFAPPNLAGDFRAGGRAFARGIAGI